MFKNYSLQHRKTLLKLERLWTILVDALINSSEPKVSWKRDRQNNLYLEIYDPHTEKRVWFSSEQEARVWLETRHNC